MPGETRSLTPIALEPYEGGWEKGVDIYKEWRNSWMSRPQLPSWVKEPHAWQQIHINSPEDELRVRFRDLVKIGEDCARHGVKAIQLVGWNAGGQDQGNPSHDPDPRLGTFEELKEAITKIQALGVKVVLFCKFTWADRATERFRKDLIRLSVKDPYGDYYLHQGYQYQTATQLLDINTKRLVPMCFLSEEYLKICEEEFKKVLELGVDGILFDECLHHSPALLCFDTSHGHRYGALVYANDRELIRRLANLTRSIKKEDFLFAGEACYDWEFEVYHLSYHRSWSKDHIH
jgi:sugar phosphate isomerase/epimerase